MSHRQRGDSQPRDRILSPRALDRLDFVLRSNGGDRFVHVGKRVFQELHDLGFGLDGCRSRLVIADLDGGFS